MTDEPLPDRALDSDRTCHLCGDPIDIGHAWMRAAEDGVELRAHSGCVYRDETDPVRAGRWQPTEGPLEAD